VRAGCDEPAAIADEPPQRRASAAVERGRLEHDERAAGVEVRVAERGPQVGHVVTRAAQKLGVGGRAARLGRVGRAVLPARLGPHGADGERDGVQHDEERDDPGDGAPAR
jgi:hypothetical protein